MNKKEHDERDILLAEINRMRAQNTRFHVALLSIADATRRCVHDGGFDREIGQIGCYLGDKCVCIGIYPIAITALNGGGNG